MEVFEDQIQYENGAMGIYGYVRRNNGVSALVLTPANEVLLVKQYRYPIQEFQWGIPGGGIDPSESAEEAVRREIFEETGIQLGTVEKLAQFYPLSSNSTENETVFIARVPDAHLPQVVSLADESFLEKRFIPLGDVLEMIDSGEITEVFACNALQMVARKLQKERKA